MTREALGYVWCFVLGGGFGWLACVVWLALQSPYLKQPKERKRIR
jgi:hypothetical protein